jgi:hypothetical protein
MLPQELAVDTQESCTVGTGAYGKLVCGIVV